DVAPPAVVEAERDEDGELDPDDDEDRPLQQCLVVDRRRGVEAERERQPPRERDENAVGGELPDAMSRDQVQARTAAASRMTLTTRSCVSAGIPAHIGSARFSAAAFSVSGSEPSVQPR